jgi:hypothetical protein
LNPSEIFGEAIGGALAKTTESDQGGIKVEDFREKHSLDDGPQIISQVKSVVSKLNSQLHQIETKYGTQLEIVITDPPAGSVMAEGPV